MSTQQESGKIKSGDAITYAYAVANIHATAIATIIRKGFGAEALSWNALLAMIAMWALYAATADKVVLVYCIVWLVFLIWRRIETMWLLRKGAEIHSRYAGYPLLHLRMSWFKEETVRGFLEPIMLLFLGTLICYYSTNLGGFIMLGFLSFGFRNAVEGEIIRRRVMRMKDAELEQRHLSQRVRE